MAQIVSYCFCSLLTRFQEFMSVLCVIVQVSRSHSLSLAFCVNDIEFQDKRLWRCQCESTFIILIEIIRKTFTNDILWLTIDSFKRMVCLWIKLNKQSLNDNACYSLTKLIWCIIKWQLMWYLLFLI